MSSRYDPVLLAHGVRPLFYSISGSLAPVSIRDQMVRAKLIVDRAWKEGLISEKRRLLVVGSGAGGATAAIRACQLGAPTLLVDKVDTEEGPFSQQRKSQRWISPTQYDWPLPHWTQERFPWTGPRMPLRWRASRSNLLVTDWERQLKQAELGFKNLLEIRYQTPVRWQEFRLVLDQDGTMLEVVLPSGIERFGMVLAATGFGEEECRLPGSNYAGVRFWDFDQFEQPDLGLPHLQEPRVLISGGGDGGLQDFIRILSGRKSAQDLSMILDLQPYLRELQSELDQAQRAFVWSTPEYDHAPQEELQRSMSERADRLLRDPGLGIKLDRLFSLRQIDITLAFPCSHFGNCYGLNRFLALLLTNYLKDYRGTNVILPRTRVMRIEGVGHSCLKNDPLSCYEKPHHVTFEAGQCNGISGPPVAPALKTGVYDVVILRHGVRPPEPVFVGSGNTLAPMRQLLPYYASW